LRATGRRFGLQGGAELRLQPAGEAARARNRVRLQPLFSNWIGKLEVITSEPRDATHDPQPETARMSRPELYTGYFGLKERPFSLTPDPSFLYWAKQHKRAFAVLEYGILAQAPITLITGEVGSGKTTLVQALLARVEPDVTIGLISNAQGGRGELLQWILNALSVPVDPAASYVSMFQALQEYMIAEYSAGRRVILIFDEAQNLSREGLEELRMLTNINSNRDELVQLILVGQPELLDLIRDPSLRQLAQRVMGSYHLGAMDESTVAAYIRHRLQKAGGSGDEFTDEACKQVFEASGGVPRLVNQLCDFALLYAWSAEKRVVDPDVLAEVLDDGISFGVLNSHVQSPEFKRSDPKK
jgi:general secretion pathway protein A